MRPPSLTAVSVSQALSRVKDPRQDPALRTVPFTQDMASLALAILKSVPEGRSTEEYIAGLQSRINQAPKAQAPSPCYIDTFEYWRDQCTNLILEKKALEEKISKLENPQPRSLLADPEQDPSQKSEAAPAEANGRGASDTPRKRAFVEDVGGHSLIKIKEAHLHAMLDDPIHKISGQVFKLGRNRTHLESISKSIASVTEIDELSNFTSKVILVLDNTISEVCLAVRFVKTDDADKRMLDMLKTISDQVILSFLSSFRALNELCRTILGRRKRGKLIYQMSMFFHKALDLLHTLSSLQSKNEKSTDYHYLRRKRVRVEEAEYAANKYLARTLATIVYNLDWNPNHSVHSELLEGIIYVVLEHTGKLLSETVFGEHVAASENPGNITNNSASPMATGVSKYETRYVIHILQNALGGSDKEGLFLRVLATGKKDLENQERLGGSGTISVRAGDLLAKAKTLLQSTLLKTALGCDELETFNSPPIPAEPPELLITEEVEETSGSEWFVEAVWNLIGWDLVL